MKDRAQNAWLAQYLIKLGIKKVQKLFLETESE
jgi:hypothetical protein